MAPAQSKMLNPLLTDDACCVVCDTNKQIGECHNGHHQCLKCSMKRFQCVLANHYKRVGVGVDGKFQFTCFMCREPINYMEQWDRKLFAKMMKLAYVKTLHQYHSERCPPPLWPGDLTKLLSITKLPFRDDHYVKY